VNQGEVYKALDSESRPEVVSYWIVNIISQCEIMVAPNMVVKSLEKALKILLSFEPHRKHQTLLQISKNTSIPATSLYRFLKTFDKCGFITTDAHEKSYQLGPALFRLGMLAHNSVDLREAAKPETEMLAEMTGESIFLTVRHGDRSVCIQSVEGRHRLRLTQRIGAALPLHAGAAARLLLAYMADGERQQMIKSLELRALGPRTITKKSELERGARLIQSKGYAISREEVDAGTSGVAVPIFSHSGEVVAALACGGPVYRLNDETIRKLVRELSKASGIIGRKLSLY
jgi:DNA-binding IclR family transcriptional regulator